MQKPEMTLTGAQLRDAFICLCGEDSETEATLGYRDAFTSDEGEAMPAGLYGYITEYPEEGLVGPLGELTPENASNDLLAALTALVAAEDESIDQFTASQIDAIEAAMKQARAAIAKATCAKSESPNGCKLSDDSGRGARRFHPRRCSARGVRSSAGLGLRYEADGPRIQKAKCATDENGSSAQHPMQTTRHIGDE